MVQVGQRTYLRNRRFLTAVPGLPASFTSMRDRLREPGGGDSGVAEESHGRDDCGDEKRSRSPVKKKTPWRSKRAKRPPDRFATN